MAGYHIRPSLLHWQACSHRDHQVLVLQMLGQLADPSLDDSITSRPWQVSCYCCFHVYVYQPQNWSHKLVQERRPGIFRSDARGQTKSCTDFQDKLCSLFCFQQFELVLLMAFAITNLEKLSCLVLPRRCMCCRAYRQGKDLPSR